MSARGRDTQTSDLERENKQLRQELAHKEEEIRKLAKEVAEQRKQIADAQRQIADLERQLALRQQNSTNSSKPPSSDGLAGEPRERGRRKKSRRKVGGQPGHRGAHRPLVPITQVDEIRSILPDQCQHCGHPLPTHIEPVQTAGEPRRHQVTELPPIQARTLEYQGYRLVCPECGQSTRAAVPEEATGHFGPQLTALIAYLTVVCRMPRRVVEALLGLTARSAISPRLCSSITTGSLLSWNTRASSPPTTAWNVRSAPGCSGARSASATAAPMANWPRLAC